MLQAMQRSWHLLSLCEKRFLHNPAWFCLFWQRLLLPLPLPFLFGHGDPHHSRCLPRAPYSTRLPQKLPLVGALCSKAAPGPTFSFGRQCEFPANALTHVLQNISQPQHRQIPAPYSKTHTVFCIGYRNCQILSWAFLLKKASSHQECWGHVSEVHVGCTDHSYCTVHNNESGILLVQKRLSNLISPYYTHN